MMMIHLELAVIRLEHLGPQLRGAVAAARGIVRRVLVLVGSDKRQHCRRAGGRNSLRSRAQAVADTWDARGQAM